MAERRVLLNIQRGVGRTAIRAAILQAAQTVELLEVSVTIGPPPPAAVSHNQSAIIEALPQEFLQEARATLSDGIRDSERDTRAWIRKNRRDALRWRIRRLVFRATSLLIRA